MKRIFKILLTLAIAVCIFTTSISAKEFKNSEKNNSTEIIPNVAEVTYNYAVCL